MREEGVPASEQAPIGYEVHRRRLRSVLQDLIYVASRVVFHARQWALSFGRAIPWYPVWQRVYCRFARRRANPGGPAPSFFHPNPSPFSPPVGG